MFSCFLVRFKLLKCKQLGTKQRENLFNQSKKKNHTLKIESDPKGCDLKKN